MLHLMVLPAGAAWRGRASAWHVVTRAYTGPPGCMSSVATVGEAMRSGSSTGLDDRQLVVYRLGDANRLRLSLATVRQTVIGPRRPLDRTQFLTAGEVWLGTDPPLALDVDGEIRGRTPARISLEANALRVMVGTDFVDR